MAATTRTSTRQRLHAAHALELLLLDQAQDLGLQRQRQVADLVQEQRAVVGHLGLAHLAPARAGEGALLVAEQLVLEQRLGDGGAVDGHEGALGAVGELVQRAGQQLLAGAALAQQQHGGVGGGRPLEGQHAPP